MKRDIEYTTVDAFVSIGDKAKRLWSKWSTILWYPLSMIKWRKKNRFHGLQLLKIDSKKMINARNIKTRKKYLGGICWAANILCLFFSTLGRSAWISSDTLWLLVGPDLAGATGAGCPAGLALAGSGFAAVETKKIKSQSDVILSDN